MGGKKDREGADTDPLTVLNGQRDLVNGLLASYHTPHAAKESGTNGSSGSNKPIRRVTTLYDASGKPRLEVVSLGGILTAVKVSGVEVYSLKSNKKKKR